MVKLLLFDFDGVIVDSVGVKTNAFLEIFKDYPQYKKTILQYHELNGGLSRYIKIRHIYEQILKERLSDEKLEQLCQRFSELVKEGVIKSAFIEGAEKLLEDCLKRYKMFLISATPDGELKEIVARRKLTNYFVAIYGSPPKKAEIIRAIIQQYPCKPQEVIFIGDSVNDFNAATEAGVRFVAKVGPERFSWMDDPRIEFRCHNLKEYHNCLNDLVRGESVESKS